VATATEGTSSTVSHTNRLVLLSLVTQVLETAALVAAAVVTGSSALIAQTFAAGSDVAVQLFLVVGVRTSMREADESHPLGYGRERYFWSLFASLAVFVSGFAVAIVEGVRSVFEPAEVSGFAVGYAVLAVTLLLEGVAFAYALREVRRRARRHSESIATYLRSTTEPATSTELIGNGLGLAGGVLATLALALTQATGSKWPDAIASILIGLALMAAAIAITQQNRALLTGRGISRRVLDRMSAVVAAEDGVIEVPELLAVVIGPSSLVVDGAVTLRDELTAPEIEGILDRAAADLRSRWPEIRYVYLTPIGEGGGRSQTGIQPPGQDGRQ
jgi:cation diffusion facilitator family transporter